MSALLINLNLATNPMMLKVVNKFTIPHSLLDKKIETLTQLNRQEFYDFRNWYITAFKQNNRTLSNQLNQDALSLMFLMNVHGNYADRVLAPISTSANLMLANG